MKEFGASEAKSRFGHLLDIVEHGGEVAITRYGKEVARMISAKSQVDREQSRAAVQRIRERAEKLNLGRFDWPEWKAYRDEGRPCV